MSTVTCYPVGTRVRHAKRIWSTEPHATVVGSLVALDGSLEYVVQPDGTTGRWDLATWPAPDTIGPPPAPPEPEPVLPASPPDEHALDAAFAAHHARHPEVYETLVRLARQAKAQGRQRCGIKLLAEVARWESFLSNGGDGYRLNNNLVSRYSRLIMEQEPDLAGFFETRGLRS